jgi:hypothetical protein
MRGRERWEGWSSWPAWPFPPFHQVWVFEASHKEVIQNNPGHPYDESSDVLPWRIFRFEFFLEKKA